MAPKQPVCVNLPAGAVYAGNHKKQKENCQQVHIELIHCYYCTVITAAVKCPHWCGPHWCSHCGAATYITALAEAGLDNTNL